MAARRLLFFPDHLADPVWDVDQGGGMVSLDDLPVRSETRAEARQWNRRWETLAMEDDASQQEWEALNRDGRDVWQRVQADLGESFMLGWAHFDDDAAEVEWFPGAAREPRPTPSGR